MAAIYAKAWAAPGVFGPWVTLTYQVTPLQVTIEAMPVGGTAIQCQAHYYDESGNLREPLFPGIIRFATGNFAHNIRVRFMGLPLGTAVDVAADLSPVPSVGKVSAAMELLAHPVSQWSPDDVRSVMLERMGRPATDPLRERLASLERQWFRQTYDGNGR